MKEVYVVTMYKIAIVEKHSYVLGVYTHGKRAIKEALECMKERDGKYSTTVLRIKPNDPESKELYYES